MSTDLHCPRCCWMFYIYLGDSECPYICCFMSTDLHYPQCCWMFYIYLGDGEGPYICCLCLRIYTVHNVQRCSISTVGTAKVHIYCFMSTDLHCPQCSMMFYIYLGDSEGPYMLFYVYGSTLSSMFKMFYIYLGDSEGPYICCFMSTDLHCP